MFFSNTHNFANFSVINKKYGSIETKILKVFQKYYCCVVFHTRNLNQMHFTELLGKL